MEAFAIPQTATISEDVSMPKPLSDAELEHRIHDALPRLLRLATRLSGNADVAEDALQDALLKVSRSWKRFRGEAALETWMTRILIRCVADQLRKRGRLHESIQEDNRQDVSRQLGPVEQTLADERREQVRLAIGQLPDRQREVLALSLWEGKSTEQIAELLRISKQNVYANLHASAQD
ncbi:MAG: sigma-70 family RNA polymerase sigma factor [Pirellulaceae bacterium]